MKLAEDLRLAVLQAAIEGSLTGGSRDNWRFVRLRDVGITSTGTTPSTEHRGYYNGDIPFIGSADLNFYGTMNYDTDKKLTQEGKQKSRCVNAGSVLQVYIGTIGKVNVTEKLVCFNQQINAITPTLINAYFLCYVLRSPYWQKQIQDNASKTTLPILNRRKWENLIIPFPPLDEQRRIVSRLDAILPLIDELELAENELEALERSFPGDMRGSLFQATIEGKLTGGKREGWRWVRLGDVGTFVRGHGIKKSETIETGKPCIRYGQLYTTFKTLFSEAVSFVPDEIFQKSVKVHKNDILMALTGENNVDIALAIVYTGDDEIAMEGDMTKFTTTIDPMYVVYFMNSPFAIRHKSKLATGQHHCTYIKRQVSLNSLPPSAPR